MYPGAGTTIPDSALSQMLAQRGREEFARRRKQTEARLARERARNTRLALACYVVLTAALAGAYHFGWMPSILSVRPSPEETANRQFGATRTGQVLFTMPDGAFCREAKFNNDTGELRTGRTARCEAFVARGEAPVAATPGDRVLSIRDSFAKRQ